MVKNSFFLKKNTLNLNGNLLSLESPKVMGILNITPDSFYSGSRKSDPKSILLAAEKMLEEGATFLDIGGYSSRPGATDITIKEEIDRVIPAIKAIKKEFPKAPISIDTFRAKVASEAHQLGANIINDISGGELDPDMFDLVAKLNIPYIMMHMKGTPQNMVTKTSYEDILNEVLDYFQKKLTLLRKKGVSDIILDPGFGFAKNKDQSYLLLKELRHFNQLGEPLLVGVSRKSLIYKSLGISPEEALNGTTVLNTIALMNGAKILRVHDVKAAVEAVKLVDLMYN